MKRKRLILLGLAAMLLIGSVAMLAGRHRTAAAPALAIPPRFIDPNDPEGMQATMRYRQCQPHHWRYVMLNK